MYNVIPSTTKFEEVATTALPEPHAASSTDVPSNSPTTAALSLNDTVSLETMALARGAKLHWDRCGCVCKFPVVYIAGLWKCQQDDHTLWPF